MVASELRFQTPDQERFLTVLSPQERQRVRSVIDVLDGFPLSPGDLLWVVGTGSVAQGNRFARDIDIAVWTSTARKTDVVRHLEDSFTQSGATYQIDQANQAIGLPMLLPKNQRLKTPTGRPIHLIIGEISGNRPELFPEAFKNIPGFPLLEFLNKRG